MRPGIFLWNGMEFPVKDLGGKCIPEFVAEVGCSFPTGPQAETASHFAHDFWDTVSATRMTGRASAVRRGRAGTG